MTTYTARRARVIEINPKGRIMSVHFGINAPTKAINVTRLRADDPATERLAFGVLSPSGEQPLIGVDPDETAVIDVLQARFNRYYTATLPTGRHRNPDQPGLIARLLRLFGFGRKDGAR